FSPMHTPVSRSYSCFSYPATPSSRRRMYSSSSSPTHHIFFPPRFQLMMLQQNADRFPTHPPSQFAFYRFLGDEPHTPPCLPLGRRTAHPSHDPLALPRI